MRDQALHELQNKLRVLSDRYRAMPPGKSNSHARELASADALAKVISKIASTPAHKTDRIQ